MQNFTKGMTFSWKCTVIRLEILSYISNNGQSSLVFYEFKYWPLIAIMMRNMMMEIKSFEIIVMTVPALLVLLHFWIRGILSAWRKIFSFFKWVNCDLCFSLIIQKLFILFSITVFVVLKKAVTLRNSWTLVHIF